MTTRQPTAPATTPAETLYGALEELARAQREAAAWMTRALDWPRASIGVVRMLAASGPVQLTDVAARLRVDVSVASRQVGHLVDAGYVRRTVSADDRRARVLELTDDGAALAAQLSTRFGAVFAEVFADWSSADLAHAADQIHQVATAIATVRDLNHHDDESPRT